MSSHVAPHQWAKRVRGNVSPAAAARMDAHAETCARCQLAWDRIASGSAAMAAIATQADPELPWQAVRARLHWERSTAERSGPQKAISLRRPWRLGLVVGGVAAAVAGAVLLTQFGGNPPATNAPVVAVIATAPTAVRGIVTLASGDVQVDGDRGVDTFARTIGAQSVVQTGDGTVSVQFGAGTAFAVGPHSTLTVASFNDTLVELVVDGIVDVEVAARQAGQRFVVQAGERSIEVRGTEFRVTQQHGQLEVRCGHGVVAVTSGGQEVLVRRAEAVMLTAGALPAQHQVRALDSAEQTELARTSPYQLPAWSPIEILRDLSAPLMVPTATHAVRIDGAEVVLGAGAVNTALRVMSGRHLVEAQVRPGNWQSAGWIDVGPGAVQVSLDPIAEPTGKPEADGPTESRTGRAQARQKVLRQQTSELHHCVRPLEKLGVFDTYAELDITVGASGVVSAVNVLSTDLPASAADCVRRSVADLEFGAGPAVTFRQRVSL